MASARAALLRLRRGDLVAGERCSIVVVDDHGRGENAGAFERRGHGGVGRDSVAGTSHGVVERERAALALQQVGDLQGTAEGRVDAALGESRFGSVDSAQRVRGGVPDRVVEREGGVAVVLGASDAVAERGAATPASAAEGTAHDDGIARTAATGGTSPQGRQRAIAPYPGPVTAPGPEPWQRLEPVPGSSADHLCRRRQRRPDLRRRAPSRDWSGVGRQVLRQRSAGTGAGLRRGQLQIPSSRAGHRGQLPSHV